MVCVIIFGYKRWSQVGFQANQIEIIVTEKTTPRSTSQDEVGLAVAASSYSTDSVSSLVPHFKLILEPYLTNGTFVRFSKDG